MSAKVVNVKVAYIRPKYKNLKEWMADPNNVYIGRKGIVFVDGERFPKQDSPYANPYKVGRDGTREQVCELYRQLCKDKPKEFFEPLRGKTLGCWCSPEMCHGHILLEMLK